MKHAAALEHTFVKRREDVCFDRGFDAVGVGRLDGADNRAGLIVVIHVRTFRLIAEHATELIGLRTDNVAETDVRDETDVAVANVFALRDVLAAEGILEALIVDEKRETEGAEIIHRVGATHIPQPFLERLTFLDASPSDRVHNHKAVDTTVVLNVVLEREHLDEVVDVTEDIICGVFPVGLRLIDVVVRPLLVGIEVCLYHAERSVVSAVAELEFAVLQKLGAEILGVRGDTVHQFEIVLIFVVEDIETAGDMPVVFDEAVDLAELRRINLDALAELGDFVFREAQFAGTSDRAFCVGIAKVEDDVGVLVTLDRADFLVHRPFIREERGEDFVEVAVTHTTPYGEQVRGVPILCNRTCHSCLLSDKLNDGDDVAGIIGGRERTRHDAQGELFTGMTMEAFARFDCHCAVAGAFHNRRDIDGIVVVGNLPIEDILRVVERERRDGVDDNGRCYRRTSRERTGTDGGGGTLVLDGEIACGDAGVVIAGVGEYNRLGERREGVDRRSGGEIIGIDVRVR